MRWARSSWSGSPACAAKIEGLAIDVLGVRRKVRLHRSGQIAVGTVCHGRHLGAGSPLICKKTAADIAQAAFDPDNSGRFDRGLLFACLCLLRLRQRDGEHAILEICLDLVGVDAVRNSERTLERAIAALGEVI